MNQEFDDILCSRCKNGETPVIAKFCLVTKVRLPSGNIAYKNSAICKDCSDVIDDYDDYQKDAIGYLCIEVNREYYHIGRKKVLGYVDIIMKNLECSSTNRITNDITNFQIRYEARKYRVLEPNGNIANFSSKIKLMEYLEQVLYNIIED